MSWKLVVAAQRDSNFFFTTKSSSSFTVDDYLLLLSFICKSDIRCVYLPTDSTIDSKHMTYNLLNIVSQNAMWQVNCCSHSLLPTWLIFYMLLLLLLVGCVTTRNLFVEIFFFLRYVHMNIVRFISHSTTALFFSFFILSVIIHNIICSSHNAQRTADVVSK